MNFEDIKKSSDKYILIVFFIALLIGYFIIERTYDLSGSFFTVEAIQKFIEQAGLWAPFIFIITMALAIIISPIPSLPLDAAAGIVWGPYLATLYAVIGAEIGAIIAFIIARRVGREVIEKHYKKQIVICYNCSDRYLFFLVLISRLFPFFQFDIVSYGAGLTNMKLKHFALATFIGMIPMTFLFAKLGEDIVSGGTFGILFATVIIIIGFFVLPVLIEKYNFFGLRGKILYNKKIKK